jgi:hypothetical protein
MRISQVGHVFAWEGGFKEKRLLSDSGGVNSKLTCSGILTVRFEYSRMEQWALQLSLRHSDCNLIFISWRGHLYDFLST